MPLKRSSPVGSQTSVWSNSRKGKKRDKRYKIGKESPEKGRNRQKRFNIEIRQENVYD